MRGGWARYLLGLHGIAFLLFVYAPILIVVVYSFNSHPVNMMVWKSFTFDWYRSIFGYSTQLTEQALYVESTDQLLSSIKNSLIVAGTTTTISTILGTMTALALYRYHFRLQLFYRGLLYMPMVMPDIVLGIALLAQKWTKSSTKSLKARVIWSFTLTAKLRRSVYSQLSTSIALAHVAKSCLPSKMNYRKCGSFVKSYMRCQKLMPWSS